MLDNEVSDSFSIKEKISMTTDAELLRFHYGCDCDFKNTSLTIKNAIEEITNEKSESTKDEIDDVLKHVPFYLYGKDA